MMPSERRRRMHVSTTRFHVYVLRDPRTRAIGHVGVTTNPRDRLARHLADVDDSWVQALLAERVEPTLEVTMVADTLAHARLYEHALLVRVESRSGRDVAHDRDPGDVA